MPLTPSGQISSISNTFRGNPTLLRIISGQLKGRRFSPPKGRNTRPTLEKTRESIFNILQNHCDLSLFDTIDLFAGSGALGFEALSRGARHVTFLEIDSSCIFALRSNIDRLTLADSCSVIKADAIRWLKKIRWTDMPQLFLLDPPYQSDLAHQAVNALAANSTLPQQSILVLETERNRLIDYPQGFRCFRQRLFGGTRVDFVEIRQDDSSAPGIL